ncbi:MAG: hypothetical protein D6815_02045 [Candidatus Dadabacteria bacterium]|nr:MAG: hypothetical protein D6815_02045 [Candidatus Dadabacteria bacterium]
MIDQKKTSLQRDDVVRMITDIITETLGENEGRAPACLGPDTVLIGEHATITSLQLVLVVVELEQRLEEEYSLVLDLANERAVSRQRSPFRSIGLLADYVLSLAGEASDEA